MSDRPTAETWFAVEAVGPGLWRLDEPHVVDFMRANVWAVRGRDRALVFDAGNGVGDLAAALRGLLGADALSGAARVASHGHADHIGGFPELGPVFCHGAEADGVASADPDVTLAEPGYDAFDLSRLRVEPRLAGPLVDALPAGFDPARFGPRPVAIAGRLAEGDRFDLGDRVLEALHLPGHSPGGLALFDRAAGLLLAGDAIYEGELVDTLHHSDRAAYRASLARLLEAPIALVCPGHGPAFDGARMRTLIAAYLAG